MIGGIAGLSRRVRTLIVGGVLFLVLFVLALTMPVPYVLLSPGPTFNTLGLDRDGNQIITLVGRASRSTTGHLDMTTVNVSEEPLTAFEALAGWLLNDKVVVPRSAVYPPGKSQQQVDKENADDFASSQDSATTAALCELGYPDMIEVQQVVTGGPSEKLLQLGDRLVTVAGSAVTTSAQLLAVLTKTPVGTTVDVVVQRGGKDVTVPVTAGAVPKRARAGGYLGIVTGPICAAPYTVRIRLANIGGPSAGLMFALGIVDEDGRRGDLTGGTFIAGTGTIDTSGTVGPIGGIALKMIAARDKGATVFLAPKGNCKDVTGAIPDGLRVIAVSTLHEAVADLTGLRSDRDKHGC